MMCLKFLSHKRIISFRIARWLIVGASILTVIPAIFEVLLPFAVGLTMFLSIGMYLTFWAEEKMEKQKESKDKKIS